MAWLLDRLPIARWGWRELLLFGLPLLLIVIFVASRSGAWAWLAVIPALALGQLVWFFRDPPRSPPDDPAAYLSPADGVVVEISQFDHPGSLGGRVQLIGVFLSVFNVHINRAPRSATVIDAHYFRGAFVNALRPESADKNETMWIGLVDDSGRRFAVRQISGAIARRIVCEPTVGDTLVAGEPFGMIKFGSRTELILPLDATIECKVGDRVRAGETILARAPEIEGQ